MDNPTDVSPSDLRAHITGDHKPLSMGIGTTVPLSYVRSKARVLFVEALHRLVPRTSSELLTEDGCALMRRCTLAREQLHSDNEARNKALERATTWEEAAALLEQEFQSPVMQELECAEQLRDAYIQRWQRRFQLTDVWLAEAALVTLTIAQKEKEAGRCYDGPLLLPYETLTASVHDGKLTPSSPMEDNGGKNETQRPLRFPVHLDALGLLDIMAESDGLIGTFDPRTETIDEAVTWLMPALELRLRALLKVLSLEDKIKNGASNAKTYRTYRSTKSFERLVRFQVMKKDLPEIARIEGQGEDATANLSRDINETARLIGLTTRKKNKGGRPKKKHARTKPLS